MNKNKSKGFLKSFSEGLLRPWLTLDLKIKLCRDVKRLSTERENSSIKKKVL